MEPDTAEAGAADVGAPRIGLWGCFDAAISERSNRIVSSGLMGQNDDHTTRSNGMASSTSGSTSPG